MDILYICKGNVGRSQMAEAFFNRLSKYHMAYSAGTSSKIVDGSDIYSDAIECMYEIGYDMSGQKRKKVSPEMVRKVDRIVVIMEPHEAEQNIPFYLKESGKVQYWNIRDARRTDIATQRAIRDQIKICVDDLIQELG
jgi:protein-tyrosine-phosphatase